MNKFCWDICIQRTREGSWDLGFYKGLYELSVNKSCCGICFRTWVVNKLPFE